MTLRTWCGALVLFAALTASGATTIVVAHGDAIERCATWTCVRNVRPIRYAWAWNNAVLAPIRITDADLDRSDDALQQSLDAVAMRDTLVHIEHARVRMPETMTLIAAPIPMWRELPESELPRRMIASDRRDITIAERADERWRLRIVSSGVGSWWSDTTSIRIGAAADRSIVVADERDTPIASAQLAINDAGRTVRDRKTFARYRASRTGVIDLLSIPDDADAGLVAFDGVHLADSFIGRVGDAPSRFILKNGARITGKVIDAKKRPIAGVAVRFEAWSSHGERAQLSSGATATRADGGFTLDHVPQTDALLTFSKDRFAEHRFTAKIAANALDIGSMTLEEGRTVKLRVVDEAGEPIQGSAVEWQHGRSKTTDAHGVVTLEHLASTIRDVHVTAKHFVARDCDLDAQCVLSRAFRVKGRYVADMSSTIQLRIGERGRERFESIAANGTFDLDLTPDQSHELAFLSVSAAPLIVRVEGKPGDLRDLGDLHPDSGRVAFGRVVTRDGEPVSRARIWAPRPTTGGLLVSWATENVARTESLDDGTFRLSGLPSDACLLRIETANAARSFVPLDASERGSLTDVGTVTLSGGGTIVVRTNDANAEATAFARSAESALDFDAVTTAITNGVARLHNVRSGSAHVSVVTPTRSVICEGDVTVVDDSAVDFPCETKRVHVSGDVRIGGSPANGGMLVFASTAAQSAGPALILTNRSAGGMTSQQVYGVDGETISVNVDAAGRFETDALGAGDYRVSWSSASSGGLTPGEFLAVPHVDAFATHLTFGGGTIAGTVVDADGAPIAHATVMELSTHATALTKNDGSFELHGTRIGACRVQARSGVRSSDIAEIDVPADDVARLALSITDRADTIRVRVLGADGGPASGAFVFASGGAGSIQTVTADLLGGADFALGSGFAGGVRFAVSAGNRWSFSPRFGDAELKASEIVLRLPATTGALSVVSDQQDGALSIATPEGWNLGDLMNVLGSRLRVAPGRAVRIDGLPIGTYVVALNGNASSVEVRDGKLADVRLP